MLNEQRWVSQGNKRSRDITYFTFSRRFFIQRLEIIFSVSKIDIYMYN